MAVRILSYPSHFFSCFFKTPTLNSWFQLGLWSLQVKFTAWHKSSLSLSSYTLAFRPEPNCPVPQLPLPQDLGTYFTVYSDYPCEIALSTCLTSRKDPAVLYETLSKLTLLTEYYSLPGTDLHPWILWIRLHPQGSQQSYRLQHSQYLCLILLLRKYSCICLTCSAWKKTKNSWLWFISQSSKHQAAKTSNC